MTAETMVPDMTGQMTVFAGDFPLIKGDPKDADEHKLVREARRDVDAIRKKLDGWNKTGEGLKSEIGVWYNNKRYRVLGFETFQEFAHTEFGVTVQYANRLVSAEKVRAIGPAVADLNEGQAREIADLEPDDALKVVERAKEMAKELYEAKPLKGKAAEFDKGPKLTAKVLRLAREEIAPSSTTGRTKTAQAPKATAAMPDPEKVYEGQTIRTLWDPERKRCEHYFKIKIGKVTYKGVVKAAAVAYPHQLFEQKKKKPKIVSAEEQAAKAAAADALAEADTNSETASPLE